MRGKERERKKVSKYERKKGRKEERQYKIY
jgi:hypothetical protein